MLINRKITVFLYYQNLWVGSKRSQMQSVGCLEGAGRIICTSIATLQE